MKSPPEPFMQTKYTINIDKIVSLSELYSTLLVDDTLRQDKLTDGSTIGFCS